ncbi:MAG: hypothetical protein OEM62_10285 [Acidobacteriota bacterium]|nr:hypothetical protein [Acidobacteriota bacterium]
MMETFAGWLLAALGIYVAAGALFAVAFVMGGVQRIDPQAEGGSWGFRLAILPASAALWPLLARRWLRGLPPPEEHNPHRDLARSGDAG